MIYADNAATTAITPKAAEEAAKYSRPEFANPSGIHSAGRAAAAALEEMRAKIAQLLGAKPTEIYFTSGGTEADNWAIRSAAEAGARKGKKHIITSAIEHHAVLHTLKALEKQGYKITLLPVSADGAVSAADVEKSISADTALVTVMYANNEISTVQPVSEIGSVCKRLGVSFHTDAVQAAGHVKIDVKRQNIDMLSISAHKFGGPRGVGALYVRHGVPLSVYMEGGTQERGKRGGTENLPGIAGMAAALEDACLNMDEHSRKLIEMKKRLVEGISVIPRCLQNGGSGESLPGIVNFCFEGIEGEALLLMLDMYGICASSGSACTSGSLDPSHVLLALGLPHEIAHGSLRLSLSSENTMEEVETIIGVLPSVIARLRDMSPVWEKISQGGLV